MSVELILVAELPAPLVYICRGVDGCGMPLTEEDARRHRRFHERALGTPQDLEMPRAENRRT